MGRRDQEKPSARLHPAGSWREVGNDPTGLRPGLGKAVAQAEGGRDGLMAKVEVRGPRGRCLDGSFPVYYFARGKERSKWIVFLQGGDWCTRYALTGTKDSRRSCVARSRTKDGSTYRKGPHKSLEKVGEVYGELSPSPGRNPLMHRWNKVYVQNCDATSFSSSLDEEVEAGGRRLHFRGLAVIEEVVSDLLDNRGMGEATDVVLAGCSAGGLAVYLHADRVREAVLEKAAKLGRPKEEVGVTGVLPLLPPSPLLHMPLPFFPQKLIGWRLRHHLPLPDGSPCQIEPV